MPRSPIRRPAAALNIDRWLKSADDLPETLSSQSLFGNELPLEIEIGSGKGLFLATAAAGNQAHNFVGVEIAAKYAAHAAGKLAMAELDNALMISGNAEPLFREQIPAGQLEAVHVYFPDPWWKKKHRRRRVLNPCSLPAISRALRSGGQLHFWTDVLDYFEITVEMIAEIAPELGVPFPETEQPATHDLDYRTHFERRSRREQIPVYRVRYEKGATGDRGRPGGLAAGDSPRDRLA